MSQPRWLALAWGDLGVAETPGADHTRRVVRYYADVGHAQITNDETAWCAAFLGSCLERAGLASTRSLMARSYLGWGEPLGEFRAGAIAVLSRTAAPALGHVGFLIGETTASIILLGGNQSDAVTVEIFPRSRLLGLRWPTNVIPEGAPTSPPVIPDGASAPIRDPGAASDIEFNRALTHVLEMEGGWTDDPYDPGGPPTSASRSPPTPATRASNSPPPTWPRSPMSSNPFPPPPCAASIASATGCSHPART